MSLWSLWSEVFPAGRIKRQPAQVRVVRNSGECWGRLVLKDGTEMDVFVNRDWYDQEDEEAAAAFVRAARRGKASPPAGWRGEQWVPGINEDGKESIND
ncbi:MAG: hypothetical protein ACK5XA_08490 [Tagaea sp.]